VAGAGHAILGAVMFDVRIAHGYSFNDVPTTRGTLFTSRLKIKKEILSGFGTAEVPAAYRGMDG